LLRRHIFRAACDFCCGYLCLRRFIFRDKNQGGRAERKRVISSEVCVFPVSFIFSAFPVFFAPICFDEFFMVMPSEPPPLPSSLPPPQRRRFSPRFWAVLALVGLVGGWAWTLFAGVHPPAWYPRCPFFWLTGLYCPGCGSARTLHALAHGDIGAAAGYNILLVCVLPLLAFWGTVAFYRGLAQNRPAPQLPLGSALVVLVVSVVFGVLRNLPWWPFSLLAP
jgi:hypothetical protein